jgi:GH24 family phage-related lysozyme (muramidase)
MVELKERIKKHEGFVNKMYKDSLGYATIGYGHLVLPDDYFQDGVEYSEEELNEVFEKDFLNAQTNAKKLIGDLPLVYQAKEVICEMVFQLGIGGVSKFKAMWRALGQNDYTTASAEMLDSRWAKQTSKRAEELSNIMRSCKL